MFWFVEDSNFKYADVHYKEHGMKWRSWCHVAIYIYIIIYTDSMSIDIYLPLDWNAVLSLLKTWHETVVYIFMSDRWKFISGKDGRCVISFGILIITPCIWPTKCGPRENETLIWFVTDCLRKYTGLNNLIDGEAD